MPAGTGHGFLQREVLPPFFCRQENPMNPIQLYIRAFLACLLLLVLAPCAAASQKDPFSAQQAVILARLKARLPQIPIDAVSPTPYPTLFEVRSGHQLFYTDADAHYILAGSLVDIQTRKNLTAARREELGRIQFSSLPLDHAIRITKGNGQRKLAVFTDPDCPYCRRLEAELAKVDNVTVYNFLYPVTDLHPDAAHKAARLWCAKDAAAAWGKWMTAKVLPAVRNCSTPVTANLALAKQLSIDGTPTLFFEDGARVTGVLPAARIEARLKQAARATPPAHHPVH
jgi:thiol:disulfide interchange protein DsbC